MKKKISKKEQKGSVQHLVKQDLRYFPRWQVNKRVEYREEGSDDFWWSYTKDLSLDGVSLFVFGHPPDQNRVRVKIHLAEKRGFEARGRIAWSKPEATHTVFGIIFEALSQETQDLIMSHAFEPKEAKEVNHGLIESLVSKVLLPEEASSR